METKEKELEIGYLKKHIQILECKDQNGIQYANIKEDIINAKIEYLIIKMDRLTDNINELIKKIDNK